jgi:streptomycin 6-kinase
MTETDPEAGRPIRLQPLTRAKLGSLGAAGEAWTAALPIRIAELVERWQLELGRPLPGGSASYVVAVTRAGSEPAVLKMVLDDDRLAEQAETLRRADGHGYVRLLAFDRDRHALLLEQLGDSLDHRRLRPEAQLDLLADTLALAWVPAPVGAVCADKAGDLAVSIDTWWTEFDRPCSAAVHARAMEFAERRRADPGEPVVVHGDPHPGNLLRIRDPRPGGETGWCFVDPNGFVCDRAYDLGVVLRDWTGRLRGPDANRTLRTYSRRLAERSGVEEQRIWEWGFVERVSTGLYLTSFGADGLAARFLASAEALVD